MAWNNGSVVTEFILLGLTDNPQLQVILFVIFLIIYLMIITGNTFIVVIAIREPSLNTPMYFFLANLSSLDIIYSTSIIPRMLRDFLSTRKVISLPECVVQMYVSLGLAEVECILLVVMAYDRYVAICHPLHYMTTMRRSVCIKVATATWVCGLCLTIPSVISVFKVDLCGRNEIDHFECEIPELLAITCGDATVINLLNITIGPLLLVGPSIFIFVTYVRIIRSVLKIATSEGRKKAFSTCTSHILVVIVFYGLPMFSYLNPRSNSDPKTVKIYTLFYTTLTPLFNSIVYTLRNKEIITALRKRVTTKVT